jgi:hypothetical protein
MLSQALDGYVSTHGQSSRIAPIAADLRFGSARVQGRALLARGATPEAPLTRAGADRPSHDC